jgi:hypothetical protein
MQDYKLPSTPSKPWGHRGAWKSHVSTALGEREDSFSLPAWKLALDPSWHMSHVSAIPSVAVEHSKFMLPFPGPYGVRHWVYNKTWPF